MKNKTFPNKTKYNISNNSAQINIDIQCPCNHHDHFHFWDLWEEISVIACGTFIVICMFLVAIVFKSVFMSDNIESKEPKLRSEVNLSINKHSHSSKHKKHHNQALKNPLLSNHNIQ